MPCHLCSSLQYKCFGRCREPICGACSVGGYCHACMLDEISVVINANTDSRLRAAFSGLVISWYVHVYNSMPFNPRVWIGIKELYNNTQQAALQSSQSTDIQSQKRTKTSADVSTATVAPLTEGADRLMSTIANPYAVPNTLEIVDINYDFINNNIHATYKYLPSGNLYTKDIPMHIATVRVCPTFTYSGEEANIAKLDTRTDQLPDQWHLEAEHDDEDAHFAIIRSTTNRLFKIRL